MPKTKSMAQEKNQLFGQKESAYGSDYKTHLLQQYKLYVEAADRVSARRATSNTFFLATNTALVTIMGFAIPQLLDAQHSLWAMLYALGGIFLTYYWTTIIKSYRQLNTAKFQVIHELEQRLPVKLYDYEWELLGNGVNAAKYKQLTKVEQRVPYVFMAIYICSALLILSGYLSSFT